MLSPHAAFVDAIPRNNDLIPAGRISEPKVSPWFTGWKEVRSGEFVAQWVEYLARDGSPVCAYVNLPGMEAGVIQVGSTIDFHGFTLSEGTSDSECHRLIEDGYHKLMELVATEKSKAA
jgi:hypothetical protein